MSIHIEKLILTQFRGAKGLPLVLHDRMNVFVGMNGAGKSSVLDETAILLSWLVNRIKSTTASGRPIIELDIKNGSNYARLAIDFNYGNKSYHWSLVKNRRGRKNTDRSELQELSQIIPLLKNSLESDWLATLPIFVYYPINRAVLDVPLRIRERNRNDRLSVYDAALIGRSNFRTFFEWFREREDLENENRKYLDEELC